MNAKKLFRRLFSVLLVLAMLSSFVGMAVASEKDAYGFEEATKITRSTTADGETIVGLWIWGTTFGNSVNQTKMIQNYAKAGITDIYLLVKGAGGALGWDSNVTNSTVGSYPDNLDTMMELAQPLGIRVHAWMMLYEDEEFAVKADLQGTSNMIWNFTGSAYSETKVSFRSEAYLEYISALCEELVGMGVDGIHLDGIRYKTLSDDWSLASRTIMMEEYGMTLAQYNGAVKALCADRGYNYYTASAGHYVYSDSDASSNGGVFANYINGTTGTTAQQEGAQLAFRYRCDTINNMLKNVYDTVAGRCIVSCAVSPEITGTYSMAVYGQNPVEMIQYCDYLAIMAYAPEFYKASTWPAATAAALAAKGVNTVAGLQAYDDTSVHSSNTTDATEMNDEVEAVLTQMANVNDDSSYPADVMGYAFFRAPNASYARATYNASDSTVDVYVSNFVSSTMTKMVFTLKGGLTLDTSRGTNGLIESDNFSVSSRTSTSVTSTTNLDQYEDATFTIAVSGDYDKSVGAMDFTAYTGSYTMGKSACINYGEDHVHSYTSAITTPATCTADGVKTFTCEGCGNSYTEAIPATGHSYNEGEVTVQPTCTAAGSTTFTCATCGHTYAETIPATGHSYNEGEVTTQPTCTTEGIATYTCTVCGDSYTGAVPATGHSYGDGVVTKAPTCTTEGATTFTCAVCGESYSTAIPATGHNYEETVNADGSSTFTCANCGDSYVVDCNTRHCDAETWSKENGTHFAFCYACEEGMTESCVMEIVEEVPATCLVGGYKVYACVGGVNPVTGETDVDTHSLSGGCGYSYTETVDATGHNFVDGVCTGCGTTKGITMWHFWEGSAEENYEWYATGTLEGGDDTEATIIKADTTYSGALISTSNGNDHYLRMVNDTGTMGHVVAEGDIIEVKFLLENVPEELIGATDTFELWFSVDGEDAFNGSSGNKSTVDYTCVADEWITVQMDPVQDRTYDRILFDVLKEDMGFSGTTVTIDYIYVGPENSAPSTLSGNEVLMSFDGTTVDEIRYSTTSYGDYDYDSANAWFINSGSNKAPTFENGELKTVVTGENPYIQTFDGQNFDVGPMNFVPDDTTELMQLRFRLENLQPTYEDMDSQIVVSFLNSDETEVVRDVSTVRSLSDAAFDGEYVTTTLRISDFLATMPDVTAIRVSFNNVSGIADEEAAIYMDYIYMGSEENAPNDCGCHVEFKNEDGSATYLSTDVTEGSIVSYTGTTPEKLFSEDCHYIFDGWVDEDGNLVDLTTTAVTADLTLYATFVQQAHTLAAQQITDASGEVKDIHRCTGCDHTVESACQWDEGVVTTEATCSTEGVITYTCALCNATYTEAIPTIGHSYTETGRVEATCSEEGVITYTCGNCGDSYTESIPKTGHGDVELQNYIPATCTTSGYSGNLCCKDCGAIISIGEPIPATGHTTVVDVAVAPTCTETGLSEGAHCSVCGVVLTAQETIPALGHDYKAVVTAPTCTEAGYTTYTCSCGDSYIADEVAATGHSYSYTDNGDGTHTASCACGDTITEAHTYENGSCICGAVEVTGPITDETLKFLNTSFTMGEELQITYSLPYATANNYSTFYVEVVKENKNGDPTTVTFDRADMTALGTFMYRFTFNGIYSYEMGDEFVATIYATDANGQQYVGESKTFSIAGQIIEVIQNPNTEARQRMLKLGVDMLNYGTAAQNYFNYDVENPVNGDLTDAQKAYGTQTAPSAANIQSTNGSGYTLMPSVSLSSKVVLNVSVNLSGYTVVDTLEYVVKDEAGNELVRAALPKMGGTFYRLSYDGVGATNMRAPLTIGIYDNGELISQELVWSVESYCAQKIAGTDASMVALAQAMLTYGDSCGEYMGG